METHKPISQIMPLVIDLLPEPSKDLSDSANPTLTHPNCPDYSNEKPTETKPLESPWQQRRLNLDARPPMIQQMGSAVEAWCRNFAANRHSGRAIVLVGPFGCGKTQCLSAARRYVRDVRMAVWPQPWGHPPQYHSVNWSDFVRDVVEEDNKAIRQDLQGCDVVFIDDVGSEEDRFKSGAPTRLLGDVLGKLHEDKCFTFITTNVSPSGWRTRWDGRVEDRLLRMNATVVDLSSCDSYAIWKLKNT